MKIANGNYSLPGTTGRPKTCTLCSLHRNADYTCVAPRGVNRPKILFVGEAPGVDEDRRGLSLVGKGGQLLDKLLVSTGIDPNAVRITDTVRCAPKNPDGSLSRVATEHIKTCSYNYLFSEIAWQQPELIVALGKTASSVLTGKRSSIDRMRGYKHPFRFPPEFIQYAEDNWGLILYRAIPEKTGGVPPQKFNPKTCQSIEIPVVVTYHPSAALHKKNQNTEGLIASDLVYARKAVNKEPRLEGVDYRLVSSVEELSQWEAYLVGLYQSGQLPYLSYDLEIGGPDDKAGLRVFDPTAEIVSAQIGFGVGKALLIPVSHSQGAFANDFGVAAVRSFLERLFITEAIPVVGQNIGFDYKQTFAKLGLRIKRIVFDTQLAHQCLFAGDRPNDLDYIASTYCGMQGYGDGLKENLEKLPTGKRVFQNLPLDQGYIDYACGDVDAVFRAVPKLTELLQEQNLLWTYNHVFVEPLIPLMEMEINGMPIDHEVYSWLAYDMPKQIEEVKEPIKKSSFYRAYLQKVGCPPEHVESLVQGAAPKHVSKAYDFNPGSTQQKIKLLFDVMGLQPNPERVTDAGSPKTDKAALAELRDLCATYGNTEHVAIIEAIQQYTILAKLHSAYILNLPTVVHDKGEPSHSLFAAYKPPELLPWCCHPRLKQDGTQTGRLSSAEPAIHNMPGKSAVKRLFKSRWRERGGLHLQFDYSAVEVRVLACSAMANDPTLKAAFARGYDAHKYVASIIFGVPIEDVTPEQRKVCKTVNFAVLYGAGPENVAGVVGVTKAKAEQFIEDYLGSLPDVARWKAAQERRALTQGYVQSAFGRIRYLSPKVYSQGDIRRRAVNTPIQSTASDIMLTSYTRLHHEVKRLGFKSLPYLCVHDSLGSDVYPGEFFDLWELFQYQMASVPPTLYPWLDLPLEVDSDAGYSWGAMANVQRIDRQHWKIVSHKESNCDALVYQLRLAGHQIRVITDEELVDGKPAAVWHLEVAR